MKHPPSPDDIRRTFMAEHKPLSDTDGTHYTPGKTKAAQATACSTAAQRTLDTMVRAIRGSAFRITTQGLRLSASARTVKHPAAGETVTTLYHYLRPTERQYSKIPHNNVQYSYNAYGQLSVVQDGSGRSVFYYDAMGNVSKNVRTFAVPFSNKTYTFTMEFEYDSWGRACAITYPDGERVSYAYDCGGSLLSMRGAKGSTARNYIDRVSYNIYGQRSRIDYGNGTSAEYRYDDLRRLSRLKTYAMQGGSQVAVQDIVYRFDSVGNIVLDSNSAAACGGIGGQYVNRYRYDAISRLVGATQSNTYSSGNVLSAAYSPSGRLCSKQQSFTGQNSAFGYDENDKPHAPRRLFDSGLHRLHDLQWDDMGNLAQVNSYLTDAESGADYEGSRHLFWTEDNRMVNAVDDKYFSYYAYDHSGERVLKMTGKNTLLDINADHVHTSSYVDRITLYTSPYLVADDNGYTKHYYAGTERVCAVIGNGGLNNLGNFIGPDPHMQNTANSLYEKCISVMQDRQLQQNESDAVKACGQDAGGLDIDLNPVPASVLQESAVKTTAFENAMNANSQLSQQGEIAYFYHGDHLGSASWITDANGIPVQHLQYLPFGETFIDQRTSSYSERFTFTGKEKDSETGFYYFGARYYDPSLSGLFLSVDPMADKYPSISPYAYCAWNPVKLVDPDGNEALENVDWYKDENGRIRWDPSITKETKLKEGEEYLGNTVLLTNKDGQTVYGDEQGRLHNSVPLKNVYITADAPTTETKAKFAAAILISSYLWEQLSIAVGTALESAANIAWVIPACILFSGDSSPNQNVQKENKYGEKNAIETKENLYHPFAHNTKKNGRLKGARADRHDAQYNHGGKNRQSNPNQRKGADKRRNKGKRIN